MALFTYLIRNAEGNRTEGEIEATNIIEAGDLIRGEDDNITIVKLEEKDTSFDFMGPFLQRLNKKLTYTLAGKTGTAQVFGLDAEEVYIAEKLAEKLRDHALFTGFAPIENPEIAIAVVVENAGSGSSKAAPLARQVLDVYFNKQSDNKLAQ